MISFCAMSLIWHPVELQPRLHDSRHRALEPPPAQELVAAPALPPPVPQPVRPTKPITSAPITSADVLANRDSIDASVTGEPGWTARSAPRGGSDASRKDRVVATKPYRQNAVPAGGEGARGNASATSSMPAACAEAPGGEMPAGTGLPCVRHRQGSALPAVTGLPRAVRHEPAFGIEQRHPRAPRSLPCDHLTRRGETALVSD